MEKLYLSNKHVSMIVLVNKSLCLLFYFFREKPRINSETLNYSFLESLPEGTLGHAYMKFLKDNVSLTKMCDLIFQSVNIMCCMEQNNYFPYCIICIYIKEYLLPDLLTHP